MRLRSASILELLQVRLHRRTSLAEIARRDLVVDRKDDTERIRGLWELASESLLANTVGFVEVQDDLQERRAMGTERFE